MSKSIFYLPKNKDKGRKCTFQNTNNNLKIINKDKECIYIF